MNTSPRKILFWSAGAIALALIGLPVIVRTTDEMLQLVPGTLREAALSLAELRAQGLLEYIAFPEALKGKYQAFTQGDLTRLREAGYDAPMATVEEGVSQYIEWLHRNV